MRRIAALTAVCLSIMMTMPAYARGFGGGGGFHGGGFGGGGFGGGFHGGGFGGDRGFGGGSFGGGRSFGGFGDRGFSGFGGDRGFGGDSFGGGDRNLGGFGGRAGESNFGGGFGSISQNHGGDFFGGGGIDRGNFTNRPNFGGGGIANKPGFGGNHPNYNPSGSHPSWGGAGSHFPTDGGFGNLSHFKNGNFNNNNFHNWNQTNNTFNNNSVRNSFNNYNVNNFNHWGGYGYGYGYGYGHGAWWGYPGGWYCPGWSAATAWTCMGLSTLTSFLGLSMMAGMSGGGGGGSNSSTNNSPTTISNVTYEGDNVYINGTPQGSSTEYYNQAVGLASHGYQDYSADNSDGSATDPKNWQSLGVFSLAQPGQTESSMLLQLAINKDGTLRGNYFNQLTNETSTIYGSLDKKTQRISFTLGQNKGTVFDTTLADLTKQDAPVLVHYSATNTQPMMLVRLEQPKTPEQPKATT